MEKFFLKSDIETGDVHLFCTQPLCMFLVEGMELKLLDGAADDETKHQAEVFMHHSSLNRIELKRKPQ